MKKKYIRTTKDKIRTTKVSGYHKSIAKASEVKSGGRFSKTTGRVKTYSKSYGFNVKPLKGDAKLIGKHLKKKRSK